MQSLCRPALEEAVRDKAGQKGPQSMKKETILLKETLESPVGIPNMDYQKVNQLSKEYRDRPAPVMPFSRFGPFYKAGRIAAPFHNGQPTVPPE